jgi:hypothetical protein
MTKEDLQIQIAAHRKESSKRLPAWIAMSLLLLFGFLWLVFWAYREGDIGVFVVGVWVGMCFMVMNLYVSELVFSRLMKNKLICPKCMKHIHGRQVAHLEESGRCPHCASEIVEMNNAPDIQYLEIQTPDIEKTKMFYECLNYEVMEGHQLGEYLIFTQNGYVVINKSSSPVTTSASNYKPVFSLDAKREDMEAIVKRLEELGSRVTCIGEFLSSAVYEAEDFSGGVVSLQFGVESNKK